MFVSNVEEKLTEAKPQTFEGAFEARQNKPVDFVVAVQVCDATEA